MDKFIINPSRRDFVFGSSTLVAGIVMPTMSHADTPFNFSNVRRPFIITGDWKSNDFSVDVPSRGSFTLSGRFMPHSLERATMPIQQFHVPVRKRLHVQTGSDANGPFMLIHVDRGPNNDTGSSTSRLFMMRPPASFDSISNWAQIRSAIERRMRQIGQPIQA